MIIRRVLYVVDVDVSYKADGGKSNEAITRRAVHVVGYLWGCFMGATTPREALAVSRCVFVLSVVIDMSVKHFTHYELNFLMMYLLIQEKEGLQCYRRPTIRLKSLRKKQKVLSTVFTSEPQRGRRVSRLCCVHYSIYFSKESYHNGQF